VISPGFTKNNGQSKFTFNMNNDTKASEESMLVVGTIYSGEFSNDVVDIKFNVDSTSIQDDG
jgi:hypothetical protein